MPIAPEADERWRLATESAVNCLVSMDFGQIVAASPLAPLATWAAHTSAGKVAKEYGRFIWSVSVI